MTDFICFVYFPYFSNPAMKNAKMEKLNILWMIYGTSLEILELSTGYPEIVLYIFCFWKKKITTKARQRETKKE